ncbi:hypothetical protein SDJN02_02601 [Cucurbita argyrosperma subsp. argyrosperma]|nr:hypothetical protein SDJN02_02601 [Cucurbita argyrosperma subsp. argyrosperma]
MWVFSKIPPFSLFLFLMAFVDSVSFRLFMVLNLIYSPCLHLLSGLSQKLAGCPLLRVFEFDMMSILSKFCIRRDIEL